MEHITNFHCIRNTIYSVGLSKQPNPKQKIVQVHGMDSAIPTTVQQLENFLKEPQLCSHPSVRRFIGYARRKTGDQDIPWSLLNEGYLLALNRLSANSGLRTLDYAQQYALEKEITVPEALLFGSRGCAYYALVDHIIAEKIHGMHRPGRKPHPQWAEETTKMWLKANNNCHLPTTVNDKKGREYSFQVSEVQKYLPDGMVNKIDGAWRQNPALINYVGTNRLGGQIPYQIIEDMVDVIVGETLKISEKQRYQAIVKKANRQGIDPFYAVYCQFDSDRLESLWNQARSRLYTYSLKLWEQQNHQQLLEGQRIPPEGVTCRVKDPVKRPKRKIPGTIYLNNKRYYWIVSGKMNAVPLIDPATAPKFPGTIFKNGSRYYWFIARHLKRQRLIPKGERFSTDDKATAEKIALEKWKQIQRDKPAFAAKVLKHTRSKGLATKDRQLAEKIALKMWRDIQKNNPKLAAKILTDNRPEPSEHWHAQIKTDGKVRFIGSFKTKQEAQAAYKHEFEKRHGYPVGFTIQYIPKMNKVWPLWQEQKQRLSRMDEHPKMPVIAKPDDNQVLTPIIRKMQKIDWVIKNCMLVFDENTPIASEAIAVQSRGQVWYGEVKKTGRSAVIKGSASIDHNTGRIKLTLYQPGFCDSEVLIEEIYHTVFEIMVHQNKQMMSRTNRWYAEQLKSGMDPTYGIHEAFADTMVRVEKKSDSKGLPDTVIDYAKNIFSPHSRISTGVFEKIGARA